MVLEKVIRFHTRGCRSANEAVKVTRSKLLIDFTTSNHSSFTVSGRNAPAIALPIEATESESPLILMAVKSSSILWVLKS